MLVTEKFKKLFLICSLLTVAFRVFADDTSAQKPLKHESELGTIVVSGNSKSESVNAKQTTVYSWDKNAIKADALYTESKQDSVTSAMSWNAGLRYDRLLTEKWSLFVARIAEHDRFAGFTQRDNSDLGFSYTILKNDRTDWKGEAGYRLQEVDYVGNTEEDFQSARVYSEATHKFSDSTSGKLWAEYIPNFDESDRYLINAEPSLSVLLSNILSLKLGYLVKYQNEPGLNADGSERKRTDTTYSTALVAKF